MVGIWCLQSTFPRAKTAVSIWISEAGLYTLVMRSRKPEAKTFQLWVTKEVLPSIRRNGGYMTAEVAQQSIDDPAVFTGARDGP